VKKFLTVLLTVSLAASACGGDGDDDATEATTEATEEPTEAATEEPTEEPTEAATEATTGTAITLKEWAVEMPATLSAGANSFTITNGGNFPHKIDVFAGESYEALPLLSNGAIDEAALAPLAATENIAPGSSVALDADLPAGTYVFACNIAVGPNSHAARGQHLTVTVG
jgi:hypothetical protein